MSHNLALFVGHLVQEKHFAYLQLNGSKNQFRYEGNESNDKPAVIFPGTERLSGPVVQTWGFPRLSPLYVGDRINFAFLFHFRISENVPLTKGVVYFHFMRM